jgi:hypothetical protein
MRELARIQFRGDTREFVNTWNANSILKIEQKVIALYKDTVDYKHMRELFSALNEKHNMSWFERTEVEYTEAELSTCEILSFHIIGRAGIGNNEYADVYSTKQICRICGRVEQIQSRNLVLDLLDQEEDEFEIGLFQHDICETDFHEVIVSEKVNLLLTSNHVPNIALHIVEHKDAEIYIPNSYFQLQVTAKIGPLVEPTPIEKSDLCTSCKKYRQVLLGAIPGTKESELHFSRSSYSNQWIMQTSERFGRVSEFHSKLVINQKLYRLLKDNNVTGFSVQPAHLIP